MKTKIYALTEPNGVIRYIGKTSRSLRVRLAAHIAEVKYTKKDTYKCRWIRSLLSKRLFPKIQLIKEVEGNGDAEETVWIKFYREIGVRLVNTTDGGSGIIGFISESDADAYAKGQKEPRTRAVDGQKAFRGIRTCPECHKDFTAIQSNQRFCSQKHKDVFHNRAKMTGVHFIPLAYDYMKSIAESRIPQISVDEIANEMILRHMDIDERQLKKHERPGEYYRAIQGISPTEAT